MHTIVVVDDDSDFASDQLSVIKFDQYLSDYPKLDEPKTRVINLCNTEQYLSRGYYCSLLAEARQHTALPSVNTINDLSALNSEENSFTISAPSELRKLPSDSETLMIFFGWTEKDNLRKFARSVFDRYPAPILRVTYARSENGSRVTVQSIGLSQLEATERDTFSKRLEHFTQNIWHSSANRRRHRWDMAILINPDEKSPPSDADAIKKFIKAASKLGIHAETITARQATQINQYDALFIRETTAIDHHTYRLARRAERDGLVVIDDPTSILRCCNKVFMHDAFTYNKINAPRTRVVSSTDKETLNALEAEFSYPMVLKLPEGAFSSGVYKVETREQLKDKLKTMLENSALALIQEYLFTEFDWRVGVLNGRAIYACRYYMARNHWQIYNHSGKRAVSGGWDTLPTFEVPKSVLDVAIKASNIIGKGLYGVDIKQRDGHVYVIEVNDNPSIETKVEDLYLGNELYMLVMQEFVRRLEMRGR